jgi:hypothetical protein
MFGKVFCLYLMLLLFLITVMLYAWLSGMNDKRANLCNTIISGLSTLIYSATLFHICNYAHYMANTVRYQRTSHEYIYICLCVYICIYIYILLPFILPSNKRVTKFRNKLLFPSSKYECSIPEDGTHPIQYDL